MSLLQVSSSESNINTFPCYKSFLQSICACVQRLMANDQPSTASSYLNFTLQCQKTEFAPNMNVCGDNQAPFVVDFLPKVRDFFLYFSFH